MDIQELFESINLEMIHEFRDEKAEETQHLEFKEVKRISPTMASRRSFPKPLPVSQMPKAA